MIKFLSAAEFENATSSSRAEPVEIWKTRKFIEKHSDDVLSLRLVAKAVNIYPNYLSEKFKQVTGINFVDYVARTRFQRACELLDHGDVRISEVAFADFNPFRNSIASSNGFRVNRRTNIVLANARSGGLGRISRTRKIRKNA